MKISNFAGMDAATRLIPARPNGGGTFQKSPIAVKSGTAPIPAGPAASFRDFKARSLISPIIWDAFPALQCGRVLDLSTSQGYALSIKLLKIVSASALKRAGAAGDADGILKSDSESTAEETAQYLGGLAKELRTLAAKANLGFLAYLLGMVEQEAQVAVSAASEEKSRVTGV